MGMHEKQKILLIVCLLFLVSSVTALDLSRSTISESRSGWLVATGADGSTIDVYAYSPGPIPVQGANVTFTVDPSFGSITPTPVQSDSSGHASAYFAAGTKSGNAVVFATITYPDTLTTPVTLNVSVPIDHDTPLKATFDFPPIVTAGSIVPLTVTVTDAHRNRVDNKNLAETHTVSLHLAGVGGSGFWNGAGYVPDFSGTTDAAGNFSTMVRVSTIPMDNALIQMDGIGLMSENPQKYYEIDGDPVPYSISQTSAMTTDPNNQYGSAPTDGDPSHAFTVTWTVFDKYNNPIINTPVVISSVDMGLSGSTYHTNSYGAITVTFPAQTTIGVYALNASTSGNATALCMNPDTGSSPIGYCGQEVQYFNTAPVDLSITANPQGMTSLDVDPTTTATIQAKVMDIKGNPVPGAPVYFAFKSGSLTYPGGPYNVTKGGPTLSATTANVTGGYATITFRPGYFASLNEPGYNATATGMVTVTATFTNSTGSVFNRDVTLVWKNYPYLGVSATAPSCTNAHVGDSINFTVEISGDGAALKPKPIDAEMAMDISGSMGSTPTMLGPMRPTAAQYKIVYSNWSGHSFVSAMDPTKDQVGLTEFQATVTKPYSLGNNFAAVNTAIGNMVGNTGGNTNTRTALKTAIEDLTMHPNPNPNAIRAIILMTDGAYNYDGDPLARGTGTHKKTSEFSGSDGTMDWYNFSSLSAADQNLAYYASRNNIRIYTITLGVDSEILPNYTANGSSAWQIYDTMDQIAAETHAVHFAAQDGYQLDNIYSEIAGLLQETAGGNTQMDLNFGSVNINQVLSPNIQQYMNYSYSVHAQPQMYDSTYNRSFHQTPQGQFIEEVNGTRDDTASWLAGNMAFNVGTIKLNETWLTTFRLNLTKAGAIEMFGPNDTSSYITFTDASTGRTSSSFIPSLICNIREAGVGGALTQNILSLDNLTQIGSGWPADNLLMIRWNTTYTGTYNATSGQYAVGEDVMFQDPDSANPHWIEAPGGEITRTGPLNQKQEYLTIDASDETMFPPGDRVDVMVKGSVYDANPSNTEILEILKPGDAGKHYIKLE